MVKKFDVRHMPGMNIIAMLCFLVLYMPIVLLVIYSFNAGQALSVWEGFSFRWYASAWQNGGVQEAATRSLALAAIAATIATTSGVLFALATTRGRQWKGQGLALTVVNQPLMVPEIVTAVGLLSFFSLLKVATGYTGMIYLVVAHSAFCIPFAYMPVRARLKGMDLSLEQAGADLYARPVEVFRYITLPQLWPGLLSGWMLAFVISLDNVVITEFVKSAGQETLPTYMLGQLRRKVTPEINAISTALLLVSALFVVATYLIGRNRK
ncbi:ABC transporter permease [Agrobacterium radiobacter]|uniref:Spermidine/putrescine transport system permease protein PotC n=1 Tax=Agrobacterium radiobacter TaxID=362 RepID=A0ABD5LKV8_AGRRD